MNIKIISVGKIKERYLRDGIDEFTKRLGPYCRLSIVELADEATPDRASAKEEEQIRAREAERIIKHIDKNAYIIPLVIEGKQLSSEGLAKKMDDLAIGGNSDVNFIIGGSLGLDKDIIKMADFKLSFSKMTFPHQLMRLVLLEQIYRSFRINRGEPYHK